MDIKDKVIVITGAGRGLGRAIALALGAQGATLALLDINRADLEATAAMVHSQNGQCDQDSQCRLFVYLQCGERSRGRGRVCCHQGAFWRATWSYQLRRHFARHADQGEEGELVEKMTLAQWQSVIDVNLTGTFLCGREGAALMAQGGRGRYHQHLFHCSRRQYWPEQLCRQQGF